jgi:iron complex transport system substrate-binding protein
VRTGVGWRAIVRALAHCCLLLAAVVWLLGPALRAAPRTPSGNVRTGCIDRFDPGVDYFPEKAAVDDAVNFVVEYRRSYKLVSLKVPYAGGRPERYVLLQCGAPPPSLAGEEADAQIVTVPVASLYAASGTHAALLADLDRLDVLTGIARLRELAGERFSGVLASGRVREFAAAAVLDPELVVAGGPALFMSGGSFNAVHGVIRQAGIPVVANSEWLEPTALGRAEWLKYVALFLNEERKAGELYAAMKRRYRDTREKATAQPRESWPVVMTGGGLRGIFAIAGGRSYVAALIHDAGGRYVWSDNEAVGAAAIDLETQLSRAAGADIWINGGPWRSLPAMLEDEPRYTGFRAFHTGQVWQYTRRVTATGANDYWTRSLAHPDLVLADLAKIFHPSVMEPHSFEWYIRVPAR